jgi:hypothetical protein
VCYESHKVIVYSTCIHKNCVYIQYAHLDYPSNPVYSCTVPYRYLYLLCFSLPRKIALIFYRQATSSQGTNLSMYLVHINMMKLIRQFHISYGVRWLAPSFLLCFILLHGKHTAELMILIQEKLWYYTIQMKYA